VNSPFIKHRTRTFLVYAQHFVTMISWYMICSTYTKTSPLAVVYTILTLYYCAYQDHVHLPILQMSPMQLPLHLEGISYISYFGRIFSKKMCSRMVEIQCFCWLLLKLCAVQMQECLCFQPKQFVKFCWQKAAQIARILSWLLL